MRIAHSPVAGCGILAYNRFKRRQYVPQGIGPRQGGSMTKELTLDVNGKQHKVDVDPDATGVRIRRVPFSPDRVKAALS